ncbi:bifunctional diaminohydroxyphosphoribosylaminopyrimidine deaminase/5-amino-6-(5-phosphoribosylamino)uracil reductase RibD [Microbacterium sp. YY-03]|uniref:bifunctional diaminohydroxyphosphoribosylaminopyrimidine deaminase/5-amino-6-(5-phosphoribosylamino)uracil reductase RibD n=1 Tax=Microbacterium sp. YY-03 TaxID=3421636 RepID=UPI003D16B4C5
MNFSAAEDAAMAQALALALNGPRGINPQVGAVILSPAGDVLATGWHRGSGTPHAEVDALSKLTREQTRGATAVVTLEPCNHTGRTGPCALALIEAGITRVIYATSDPGAVSGGGAERLRGAGVDVERGLLEDEALAVIDSWLTHTRLGRPHVTVKWAQTLDGRAAAADGTSQWITGQVARADVHRRRAEADAIVAGIGTILRDDAALTARDGDELLSQQPQPVVVGRREVPLSARVRQHPRELIQIREHDPATILADLHERGIHRVFIEGGPTVASAFLQAGLVDELLVYVAPALLGGPRVALDDIGITTMADIMRFAQPEITLLGDDILIRVTREASTDGSD